MIQLFLLQDTRPQLRISRSLSEKLLLCHQKWNFGHLTAIVLFFLSSAALCASTTTPAKIVTNPLNLDPQVRQAYQYFYILDYEGALSLFEKVQAAHPTDPIAADYLLNAVLFQELYRLDLLDTTFYAHDGFLTGKHAPAAADSAVALRVNSLTQQAIALAEERLKANPEDVDALFARGWARSLSAVYLGLVDRSFISALHLALEARHDDERVLELSPGYVDAKLIVGVHQYIAGSLPLGFKLVAGLAGITGSKAKGIADLREAGASGSITSVEARTALSLFLRREAKYDEAVVVMRSLRDQYPRDFLFCLEVANLIKDSGDGPRAIAAYRDLLNQVKRPNYFPSAHLELAWFGLAEALRGQEDYLAAAGAYDRAAGEPTIRPELKARCELNAGEMYDLLDQRDQARKAYQVVLDEASSSAPADSARKYLRSPYTAR
jgi:tetratricopeptide (TPR) repeat protein